MYEIAIEETFDAAHCLRDYEGNCRRLHGHTYKVRANFRFAALNEYGMAMDFRRAKSLLKQATDYLDHQYINELPEFTAQNPTAENIARFLYERIKADCRELYSVTVWETPNSCATYFEEE